MACQTLADGYKQNCPPTPGAPQYFYIALFDDIATWTNGTTAGEKDGVNMKAGKGLYKWQVQRDTTILNHTKVEEEGGGVNITHEFSFKLVDTSLAARDAVNDLLGKDIVAFCPTNANTIQLVGYQNGARVDDADGSTVAADLGHSLTLRAKQQNTLPLFFNDGTSFASTVAMLEALVVGS
jgi:hypothetical protein